jgi:starch synthase
LFSRQDFERLNLPESLWSMHAMEFHGQFSFLKGGLAFADELNTVSPTYAREILVPEFGCGLEGLLQHRQDRLCGILNGVDYAIWNPATDSLLPARYDAAALDGKVACKRALQRYFGLEQDDGRPLFGVVSRLTDQKGIDLIVALLDKIVAKGQLVLLGTGDEELERALTQAGERHPGHVGLHFDYDDALAHQIVAGADMFLMPSRFEPCGLTQLYSLRYGTIPIVHKTGGLADTVIDATTDTLANRTATGVCYQPNTIGGLTDAIERAVTLYNGKRWRALQHSGMIQDFSWERSASAYLELYQRAFSLARL